MDRDNVSRDSIFHLVTAAGRLVTMDWSAGGVSILVGSGACSGAVIQVSSYCFSALCVDC